jgi:hypothetical protein
MAVASIFLVEWGLEESQAIHSLQDCAEATHTYRGESKGPSRKKNLERRENSLSVKRAPVSTHRSLTRIHKPY